MLKLLPFVLAGVTAASSALAGPISVTFDGGFAPTTGASLDVVETETSSGGLYDVTNNTGGSLWGFGVTNTSGNAFLFGGDNCSSSGSLTFGQICYSAETLSENDWNSDAFFPDFANQALTYADLFGDFATAAGGDSVVNWFTAVDGDMQDGDRSTNYFGFIDAVPASNILGITVGASGFAAFTAGSATVPGTTPIPLPAAGWMLLAGVGGMIAMRRKANA